MRRFIIYILLVTFFVISIGPAPLVQAQDIALPKLSAISGVTPQVATLKGLSIHPDNPLQFDFIIEPTKTSAGEGQDALKEASLNFAKYFLASVAIPNEDMWVNLSPYEKDRIIPDSFGQTLMGRDLLAQDYILKQITAAIIHPDTELGQKFWEKVYAKAQELYGTTDIPINTFNKVWIMPDKAAVWEHKNSVFVIERHLKVMLEEDYLAQSNSSPMEGGNKNRKSANSPTSQIVRDIIIPALEKEVNEGETFANLREIYNAMILATWFKRRMKESFLGQSYMNKKKVAGIEFNDDNNKNKIYEQYVQIFKKGVFNFIKEEADPLSGEIIPRKYFSGGARAPAELAVEIVSTPQPPPGANGALPAPLARVVTINLKLFNEHPGAAGTTRLSRRLKQDDFNEFVDRKELISSINSFLSIKHDKGEFPAVVQIGKEGRVLVKLSDKSYAQGMTHAKMLETSLFTVADFYWLSFTFNDDGVLENVGIIMPYAFLEGKTFSDSMREWMKLDEEGWVKDGIDLELKAIAGIILESLPISVDASRVDIVLSRRHLPSGVNGKMPLPEFVSLNSRASTVHDVFSRREVVRHIHSLYEDQNLAISDEQIVRRILENPIILNRKKEVDKLGKINGVMKSREIFESVILSAWLARALSLKEGNQLPIALEGINLQMDNLVTRENIVKVILSVPNQDDKKLIDEWLDPKFTNRAKFAAAWNELADGEHNGIALISLDKQGRRHLEGWAIYDDIPVFGLYLSYLEIAPWNRDKNGERRIKGAGTILVAKVMDEAFKRGYGGNIYAHTGSIDSINLFASLGAKENSYKGVKDELYTFRRFSSNVSQRIIIDQNRRIGNIAVEDLTVNRLGVQGVASLGDIVLNTQTTDPLQVKKLAIEEKRKSLEGVAKPLLEAINTSGVLDDIRGFEAYVRGLVDSIDNRKTESMVQNLLTKLDALHQGLLNNIGNDDSRWEFYISKEGELISKPFKEVVLGPITKKFNITYDLVDKLRKMSNILEGLLDMIQFQDDFSYNWEKLLILKMQEIVDSKEKISGDSREPTISELMERYKSMLADILDLKAMDRMLNREGGESLSFSEYIYTYFLLPAADLLYPDEGQEPVAPPSSPPNQQQALGGIDMNSDALELAIKRDGQGVPLPAGQQDWAQISLTGLEPIFVKMQPVNLPELIGAP